MQSTHLSSSLDKAAPDAERNVSRTRILSASRDYGTSCHLLYVVLSMSQDTFKSSKPWLLYLTPTTHIH